MGKWKMENLLYQTNIKTFQKAKEMIPIVNTISLFFLFAMIHSFSKAYTPPLKPCILCNHFMRDENLGKDKYGKCSLYPVLENIHTSPSYDYKPVKPDHYYCSVARKYEYMCGQEGKHFVKKISYPSK
jgi:hypothetical protein